METNSGTILEALAPEEYSKRVNQFHAAGDINGFLEFQKTHNILYEDPISEQDKETLKNLEVPEFLDEKEIEVHTGTDPSVFLVSLVFILREQTV